MIKGFLGKEFEIKDLGPLKYFLEIKVVRSKDRLFLSQSKYVIYLLQDSGMLGCRPCDTFIEFNYCLHVDEGHRLIDIGHYQRLVKKMIYLSLTRPNISYIIGVVSYFMHVPSTRHLEAAYCTVCYLKRNLGQWLLYCRRHNL